MTAARFESVSTWHQPLPTFLSAQRTALVDDLARAICGRVPAVYASAVDGRTGAGKTSFGHELATAVRGLGRPTLRASLDDFKRPWRDAPQRGYDRTSGEGYYRNAHDFDSARTLLLGPSGADGSGSVVLCAHDPLTGEDHRDIVVEAPDDAVLIVDGVFSFRPEYDDLWDVRIWLDVEPSTALARGLARDEDREGREEAERLHRERYAVGEEIYVAEVDPLARADVVVDNTVLAMPLLRRVLA